MKNHNKGDEIMYINNKNNEITKKMLLLLGMSVSGEIIGQQMAAPMVVPHMQTSYSKLAEITKQHVHETTQINNQKQQVNNELQKGKNVLNVHDANIDKLKNDLKITEEQKAAVLKKLQETNNQLNHLDNQQKMVDHNYVKGLTEHVSQLKGGEAAHINMQVPKGPVVEHPRMPEMLPPMPAVRGALPPMKLPSLNHMNGVNHAGPHVNEMPKIEASQRMPGKLPEFNLKKPMQEPLNYPMPHMNQRMASGGRMPENHSMLPPMGANGLMRGPVVDRPGARPIIEQRPVERPMMERPMVRE